MKRLIVAGWCVAAVAVAGADTWYVDDDNYGSSGDGRSAATAFGTVQEAMDNSNLRSGDTVILMPGTYDQGGAGYTKGSGVAARVYVPQGNITIRSSTGKPEDVHIVGKYDTSEVNDHGIGPDSMRCLASASSAVIVQGVTFRDGATSLTNGLGGGVYANSAGGITIIDCVVSNCAAGRGGGAAQIIAHSTLFSGNYIGGLDKTGNKPASKQTGSALYASWAANCLIVNNSSEDYAPLGNMKTLVNCTVARNRNNTSDSVAHNESVANTTSDFYNMLVFNNGKNEAKTVNVYDSVFARTPTLGSANESTVVGAVAAVECANPALGDWRPLSTGHCPNRGRGEHLLNVPLPAGYTYHDMAGNDIPTNGTITVGAFQETVTPAASAISFSGAYRIDGIGDFQSGDWINSTNWPVAYRIKPLVDKPFGICIDGEKDLSGDYNFYRHALYDGWCRYMPSNDVSQAVTMLTKKCTDIFYADAVNGCDDYDGSAPVAEGGDSRVGPKKTLQEAVDLVTNEYSLVYAAPGTYNQGGSSYYGLNRVAFPDGMVVGLIASGGAGTATIVGAPDPETGGRGPNAMRCVGLRRRYSFIQGFNLVGGYTTVEADGTYSSRGAAYYASSKEQQVLDCTVTGCVGNYGVGAAGTAMRTKFIGNTSYEYFMRGAVAISCVFTDNTVESSTGVMLSSLAVIYGCTIDFGGNTKAHSGSISCGGVFLNPTTYGNNSLCTVVSGPEYFADATNVDPAARDFRLGSLSPAVGALSIDGLLSAVGSAPPMFHLVMTDIDGRDPVFGADGSLDAGAIWTDKLPMYKVEATGSGEVAVAGGVAVKVISENTEVTAYATSAVERPFLGFELNGEMQTLVSTSLVFTASAEGEALTHVRAIYGTNWYVNASAGNNSDFGSTPETARRTLKSVAEYAISGDTIHAAEGRYDEGEMLQTSALSGLGTGITIPARVFLKSGVTLVADGAAEETFIVGAASTAEGHDEWGCGEGAVRCVALQAGATVRGFTLTGGRTAIRLYDNGKANETDDGCGGAVLGGSSLTAIVDSCIVSNNAACGGGAGQKCMFRRCRIFENLAGNRAAVGRKCRFARCLIDRNRGSIQLEAYRLIDSCTIGPNAWAKTGTSKENALYNADGPVVNSLVLATKIGNSQAHIYGSNSVFMAGSTVLEEDLTNCIVTNQAAVALDDDWRPVIGANVGIDQADASLSDIALIGDTDLGGAQAIMNGAPDIGAFEADWRARYAADIGGGCTVPTVAPEVYENAAGHVFLPTGALTASFAATAKQTRRTLAFAVTGSGTFSVSVNGAVVGEFTASAAQQNCTFVLPAAGGTIALAYAPGENDADGAEILSCARLTGTSFVFR